MIFAFTQDMKLSVEGGLGSAQPHAPVPTSDGLVAGI